VNLVWLLKRSYSQSCKLFSACHQALCDLPGHYHLFLVTFNFLFLWHELNLSKNITKTEVTIYKCYSILFKVLMRLPVKALFFFTHGVSSEGMIRELLC